VPAEAEGGIRYNVFKLVKPAYSLAVRLRKIATNPFDLMPANERPKASKASTERRAMTPERERKLREFAKGDVFWYGAVMVGLDLGCCPAELFGIRVDEVNWRTGQVPIFRNIATPRGGEPQVGPVKADSRERKLLITPPHSSP
jgi:integrase